MKTIKIDPRDNCIVALQDVSKCELVDGIVALDNIPKGHKMATEDIAQGNIIIKYGQPIGTAKTAIPVGSWIHTHNVRTNLNSKLQYTYVKSDTVALAQTEPISVEVYERDNGLVGIRNELWVIPTVGCVNSQARMIVDYFNKVHTVLSDNIDGVFAFTHPYGCSQVAEDHERTKRLLQQIVKHPNAGGVLVLGLGCENNQIVDFEATLGEYNKDRVRFLVAQNVEDEIAEGIALLEGLYQTATISDRRTTRDISVLNIGLKCGGSDGLSGITANPLLGRVSDYMACVGGTTVLTEVPEMFGAETLLMARAKDKDTFDKIVSLIDDFKQYYQSNNQPIYENPSPGNKAGGITTLEDKSLGCTQKSGCSAVTGVLEEGGQVSGRGLNLLNGPGNDMVAVTNLGCAGCHLVLFTTGRGTPFGGFVPTVKISTNSDLARFKSNWIDFDAGILAEGEDYKTATDSLIEYIADVASGRRYTSNEQSNSRDIALFKTGVTL